MLRGLVYTRVVRQPRFLYSSFSSFASVEWLSGIHRLMVRGLPYLTRRAASVVHGQGFSMLQ